LSRDITHSQPIPLRDNRRGSKIASFIAKVRVPGSGLNRSAYPVCLDLARVSTLAASMLVSTTLPHVLAGSKTPKTSKANSQENQTVGVAASTTASRKRSLPGPEEADHTESGLEDLAIAAAAQANTTVAQLLEDINTLKKEKEVIQHQLSPFIQLSRNKDRLTYVVMRLGVKGGMALADVADAKGVSKKTVQRWITRWQEEGSVTTRPRSGRPRVTTQDEDARLLAA
ncbi:putative winged helix-turn-helix domain containing protein 13, partial [Homarus americanus]